METLYVIGGIVIMFGFMLFFAGGSDDYFDGADSSTIFEVGLMAIGAVIIIVTALVSSLT